MFEAVRVMRLLFKDAKAGNLKGVLENLSKLTKIAADLADAIVTPIDAEAEPVAMSAMRTKFNAGVRPTFSRDLDKAEQECEEALAAARPDRSAAPVADDDAGGGDDDTPTRAAAPKGRRPAKAAGWQDKLTLILAAVQAAKELLALIRARHNEKTAAEGGGDDAAGGEG